MVTLKRMVFESREALAPPVVHWFTSDRARLSTCRRIAYHHVAPRSMPEPAVARSSPALIAGPRSDDIRHVPHLMRRAY